jgi:hypothetical protein
MHRFIGAATFVLCLVGVALADEFTAVVTKIEDGKVTFKKTEKKGKKTVVGDEMTLPLAKDAKFTKGFFDKDTKKVETKSITKDDALELLKKAGEKGSNAKITTDADNKAITEIRFGGGKGIIKKKDKGG